jgi:hypothetical protein
MLTFPFFWDSGKNRWILRKAPQTATDGSRSKVTGCRNQVAGLADMVSRVLESAASWYEKSSRVLTLHRSNRFGVQFSA